MEFQRVSVLTLCYFLLRSVSQLGKQLPNFLPLLVILFATSESFRAIVWLLLLIGLPVLLITHAGLSWWYFRYAVDEHRLHIRDGIIKRNQLTLDFARIQQADVREPWYFRPFKLAVLGVESAGSEKKEVELAGLGIDYAYQLKAQMLAESVAQQAESSQNAALPETATDFELRLPVAEIARYGLMHNPILLLLPLLAIPLSQANLLDEQIMPRIEQWLTSAEQLGSTQSAIVLGIVAVIAVLAILSAVSVVLAVVRFYNFHLQVQHERYQSRAGLASVTTRSFQYIRLQRIIFQQGIIARLLQRKTLRVNQSGQHLNAQQKAFLIPVLGSSREDQLRQQLKLTSPNWRSIHPASIILPWLLSALFITAAAWFISGGDWRVTFHAAWIGTLFSLLVQYLIWRKRAVSLDDKWFAVRQGMIGQQQRFIPAQKIQALRLKQGPWLRLWGMASLSVYSAAGRETIRWLPQADLLAIHDTLLEQSKTFRGRWM